MILGFGLGDSGGVSICGGGRSSIRGRSPVIDSGGSGGGFGLDGVEHPFADLLGVDLEDLDPVIVGGGGAGGDGEGLVLDLAGGGGGLVGGHCAVALGEDGGGG